MEFQKLNYLNCFLIRAMFEIAQQNRAVGKKKMAGNCYGGDFLEILWVHMSYENP